MQRHIKIFIVLILLFILDLNTKAMLIPSAVEENTGVSGTVFPNVPEPLHIDLVRPLGAKKGELEINTLGAIRLGDSNFSSNWGPEIEYVIKDGLAIEFELPFENENLDELKVAFQGTISRSNDKKFIHGWQSIHKMKLNEIYSQHDLMYIHAYRINKKWSTISLSGFRQNLFNNEYSTGLINNTSFFRHINSKTKLGLETNWRLDKLAQKDSENVIAVIPQIHRELGEKYSLQLGTGFSRYEERFRPLLAMRLIWEL